MDYEDISKEDPYVAGGVFDDPVFDQHQQAR